MQIIISGSRTYSRTPHIEMNKTKLDKLFLSFDIEAVGPSPATGSMVNFGLVGLKKDESVAFRYTVNLQELPKTKHTLANDPFWNDPKRAEAKRYITQEPLEEPATVFPNLAKRLRELKEKYDLEIVAWPAAYDWQWINYYFDRFAGGNPLGYTCTCIDSYNWGVSRKPNMPDMEMRIPVPASFAGIPEHSGLLDAYRQGVVFIRLWCKNVEIQAE